MPRFFSKIHSFFALLVLPTLILTVSKNIRPLNFNFLPFLIFLICGTSQTLSAQGPLDQIITFTATNETLEDVLFDLSDLAAVSITFNSNLVAGKRVSIQAVEERLGAVLDQILTPYGIRTQLAGSVIVLVEIPIKKKYTVSGYLSDANSGEPLIGANVYLSGFNRGTSTNAYGFFSLTLDEGNWQFIFSYLGYQSVQRNLVLSEDLFFGQELEPNLNLPEVVITAPEENQEIGTSPISKHHFIVSDLDRLPSLGGEVDVLRNSYFVPGVQTGADGFGGISVRGGSVDQNLYLLDGVPVYNATHLLGVYSVFNSSAVHSATLYKGVVPARYGGRASSVLDVRTKEGNLKEPMLALDLGLTSGKFTMEGPLPGGKSSYILTGRRSFIDLYTRPLSRYSREAKGIVGELAYFFYDFNAKINISIGNKDRLYLSFYNGGDNFINGEQVALNIQDTTFFENAQQTLKWGNTIASFRWNHLFGKRLFLNTTITYSSFGYRSEEELDDGVFIGQTTLNRDYLYYEYASENEDIAVKLDFDFSPNPDHYLRFGLNFTRHIFKPGAIIFDEFIQRDTAPEESLALQLEKSPLQSDEFDLYVEDEIQLNDNWSINLGLRLNALRINEKLYASPQPRFLMLYKFNRSLDMRVAAGRATQSLHLLSNSGFGLPRDLWVSATERIKPIQSWQYSLGFGWNGSKGWGALVEGYYKTLKNLLDFQESVLADIDGTNWQNQVIVGTGESYGVEFQLEKKSGRLLGRANYTLAYSTRTFEEENMGKTFPFKLDRRHNFGIELVYNFNKKWSASTNFVYRTGEKTTLPRASYQYNQLNLLYADFPPQFPFFFEVFNNGEKNSVVLAPYHRLDINIQYQIKKQRANHTFNLGFYNVYLRRNPWFYSLVNRENDNGVLVPQYVQFSYVPFLPSLRYRIEFYSGR